MNIRLCQVEMSKDASGSFNDEAERRELKADYTLYQKSAAARAFASMLVLAVEGVIIFGFNVITLSGAMDIEITYLGTEVIMLCVLGFLYWRRIRWSYVYGIGLLILGFFGGFLLAVWNHIFYFSVSLYNISIIFFYVTAAVCLYFSYRSFKELPRVPKKEMVLGIGGTALVTIFIGAMLWSSSSLIHGYMLKTNLQAIDNKLQDLNTLNDKIQYLMTKCNIPSLVVGIVVNDSLVWSRGYGGATQDTAYLIASIRKPSSQQRCYSYMSET